jgi:hypothetical protein
MAEIAGYGVNGWGSHPDAGNDDWWTCTDCATLAEAEAAFSAPVTGPDAPDVAYVELVRYEGATMAESVMARLRLRRNPGFQPGRADADDGEWQREIAREAGMLHGVDAYNDAMGWSLEHDGE